MKYTKSEKEKLGKLFYYYRKKNHISFKELEFENLSSLSTLHYAEKGKIIKTDLFYDRYLSFYKLSFIHFEYFEEWLHDYLPRLFHVFEYYENHLFEVYYDEMRNHLEKYSNYVIYHEYYQIFEYLFKNYIKQVYMTEEEIKDALLLCDSKVFEEELQIYLLDNMARSNCNSIGNYLNLEVFYNRMVKLSSEHLLTKKEKAFILCCKCDFLSALNLYDECYEYALLHQNDYRICTSLLSKFGIYRNIDQSLTEKTIVELLKMKRLGKVYPTLLAFLNYNVGMEFFLSERYEKAYELFMENLRCGNQPDGLLFILSICSRLNMEVPSFLSRDEILQRDDAIFLKYFRIKAGIDKRELDQKKREDVLVEVILKEIYPIRLKQEKYFNPYWNVFEYEMRILALKNRRHRKYYIEFQNKMRKLIQNI